MKLNFEYEEQNIEFDVQFKKRRSMVITIEPPDIITVKVPIGTSGKQVIEIVKGKANWILKKLNYYSDVHPVKHEFVNGEVFMYLGRNYYLQVEINSSAKKPEVNLIEDKFVVTVNNKDAETIRSAMEKWYRLRAKEIIDARIRYYQRYFTMQPAEVRVKQQKRRWGSCTYRNVLLFNWRCVMAEASALDYIVVHEMCHMKQKDHSPKYWKLVESIFPDYKAKKEWLKINGIRMNF